MFYGIGKGDDAFPSIPFTAKFKKADGSFAIAYWLGWHPQEYTPEPAYIELTIDQMNFKKPVLVDLLTGKVFKLNDFKNDSNKVHFNKLPLLDYPFLILEQSEVKF
jgi:hypothetical protein